MTMATMEETGVQNNDEGPHEQKIPHSANYTAMEDVMVTMAYFKASEDSICGAKQKGHTFRSKIELAYNTIKKQQEEKEAQDLLQPSHLRAMDTVAMPYTARAGLSLSVASGEELKVCKRCLHDIYKAKYLPEFKFILATSLPRTTQSFSHFSQWRQQTNSLLLMKMVMWWLRRSAKIGLAQPTNIQWAQREQHN